MDLEQFSVKKKSDEGKLTVINLLREDTAQSIGIATKSLIRTLADFKKEGLLDMQAGKNDYFKRRQTTQSALLNSCLILFK
ncbi:MAG: helix-turn-helix domain-containing protein [Bacteroidota bacterium]|nr:helix-turn-helix domain-containing protein [Bacteroidota bacterium]